MNDCITLKTILRDLMLSWHVAILDDLLVMPSLDTVKGHKAAIDRDDNARHKASGVAAKPNCHPDQLIRVAKAFHWGMINDRLSAGREALIGVSQERPVLLTQKETGCDGVDPHPSAIFMGKFHCQPLSIVV